jgi:ubiquinone/menaquinone biosynthesis C-methylase UbiE
MVAEKYDCSITGIDLSEILVAKARERANERGIVNAQFRVGDARELSFDDDTFDSLFAVAVTALIPDKLQVSREYIRVVKPGGTIGKLDLFMKESAPREVRDQFTAIFRDILGSDNEIITIDEWRDLFEQVDCYDMQVDENYTNVFEMPRNRTSAAGASFRLLYHMIITGYVRRNVSKLLEMSKTVNLKSEGEYENVGDLTFTAKKLM